MNIKKEDLGKIQQALSSAYKAGEAFEVGDAWRTRVMVRIRDLGPLKSRHDFLTLFEWYTWRFAPVAALSLLVLSFILYRQTDFLSDCEMAKVFMKTRWDDTLFQFLGAS